MFRSMSFKFLTVTAFLLAANGAQASTILHVMKCSSTDAGPDHGTYVNITKVIGPPIFEGGVTRPISNTLTASLTEETIAGERQLGVFRVLEKKTPPGLMGAPKVYVGRGFKLVVNVDTAPVPGGIRSHLTAEAQGRRVSEDMTCQFLR